VIGEGGNVVYRERDKELLKLGGEKRSAREVGCGSRRRGIGSFAASAKRPTSLDEVSVVAFVIKAPGVERRRELSREVIATCAGAFSDFKSRARCNFVERFPLCTLRQDSQEPVCRRDADAY